MSPAVVVTYSLYLFYFYFPGLLNNLLLNYGVVPLFRSITLLKWRDATAVEKNSEMFIPIITDVFFRQP